VDIKGGAQSLVKPTKQDEFKAAQNYGGTPPKDTPSKREAWGCMQNVWD